GLRRRGYPAAAIREFCNYIGVSRTNSRHQIELLESFVRQHLNRTAQRRMAVLDPLRLVITDWPEGRVDEVEITNNPEDPADGTRRVAFTGELWIERDDFRADPPPKYFRLTPGREVRLRGAYLVTCTGFEVGPDGEPTVVYATHDPESRGGNAPDGRKVKSTMHWVSVDHALEGTAALYERLFSTEVPGEATGDPMDDLDRSSKTVRSSCRLEPALADLTPGTVVQFERLGYFALDPREPMLFHRTVGLRDEVGPGGRDLEPGGDGEQEILAAVVGDELHPDRQSGRGAVHRQADGGLTRHVERRSEGDPLPRAPHR
ncbi:MAG: hypothetical protein VW685_05120, partial [Ilumatobacter sp.]